MDLSRSSRLGCPAGANSALREVDAEASPKFNVLLKFKPFRILTYFLRTDPGRRCFPRNTTKINSSDLSLLNQCTNSPLDVRR